jgi:hypothetical protein
MMPRDAQDMVNRRRKGKASAQPLPDVETMTNVDDITESLIETFPASDPPAWVAVARVGPPKRQSNHRTRKAKHVL